MSRFLLVCIICVVGCGTNSGPKPGTIEVETRTEAEVKQVTVKLVFPSNLSGGVTPQTYIVTSRNEADKLITNIETLLAELKLARDGMPVVEPQPKK